MRHPLKGWRILFWFMLYFCNPQSKECGSLFIILSEEIAMRRNVFTPFFFVAVLVLVVGLACGLDRGGGETEVPAPVIQPTPVNPPQQPQTQPTQGPFTPVPPVSRRFFIEDFNASVSDWKTFVTRGELNQLNASVDGGYYIFELLERQVWGYALYTPETYADVRLDVVADNRGANDNNVSLVCRYSEDEGWYEASIANNGKYWIYYGKWDDNGTTASYAIAADGGSTAIRTGKDVNTYTLICKGRTISLMINGKEIRTVDDNLWVLRDGQVGVGVSSFTQLPIKVEFDSVEISEP
jgi:hypothetical protein